MNDLLLTDAVRFVHILCVTVGIGTSFFADLTAISRLNGRIDAAMIATLRTCHRLIWVALLGMWLTGLGLIYIRTGFILENFSPKLFSKLGVVSVLTINALMIGAIAMPVLRAHLDRPVFSLSLGQLLSLSLMAGVSTASWLLALAMGTSKVLAQSGWSVFIEIVPLAYLTGVAISCVVVLLMQRQANCTIDYQAKLFGSLPRP